MAEVDTVQIPTVTQPVTGETVATMSKAIKTLGLPADAKSTATDTTSITFMQVFKQISASIQSLVTAIGSTAWDLGGGTSGTRTQRVIVDTSQLATNKTAAGAIADGFQQTDVPTDGVTAPRLGGLTETAPTTDTASSGLNGRLQRIAQRITSMIALLPAALGAGGGLKVDGSGTALPVSVAPSTTDVAVTPTVTASVYTANNCIGGIMTFASILAATSFNGILQSITAKFKGAVVTSTINVHIFKANPSNGTYTDKTAVTWNAADMANLLGTYQLTSPLSTLGTMTSYNLDGIGKSLVGASQSLFVVATITGTPTPASTSDFTLELSVLPG